MGFDLKKELRRLKETGKIPSYLTGREIGMLLDAYNQGIDAKKEKEEDREIHERNMYYYPLIRWLIKEGLTPYRTNMTDFKIKT